MDTYELLMGDKATLIHGPDYHAFNQGKAAGFGNRNITIVAKGKTYFVRCYECDFPHQADFQTVPTEMDYSRDVPIGMRAQRSDEPLESVISKLRKNRMLFEE